MTNSDLIVVSGHLGSGKTEFSLNFTTHLKAAEPQRHVALCDLDFINPYFRSRRHKQYLESFGVEVVTPVHEEVSIADMPSISGKIKALINDHSARVVLEVGGDSNGAIVIAHLKQFIQTRGYSHYMVLNLNRPDTCDYENAVEMMRSIEKTSGLPVTDIILNNHLMNETTAETVVSGYKKSAAMNFSKSPIKYICVSSDFLEEARGIKIKENEEWFVLNRVLRYAHEV